MLSLEDAVASCVGDALGDASTSPPFVRTDRPEAVGAPQHPRHHFKTSGEYVGPHEFQDDFTFYDMSQVDKTPEALWDEMLQDSTRATLADVPAMSFSPPTALPTAEQYAFLLASIRGVCVSRGFLPGVSVCVCFCVSVFLCFCISVSLCVQQC